MRTVGLAQMFVVGLLVFAATTSLAQDQNTAQDRARAELGALDIVRPTLPEAAAAEVAELQSKITTLQKRGVTAETREAQDAALDEAIALAQRALVIRELFQGNTAEVPPWRTASGEPSKWWELIDAHRTVSELRQLRTLNDEDRAVLATLIGTDEEAERLYGAGQYAEALAITERQLAIRRRVLGDEHSNTLASINEMAILLKSRGRHVEAETFRQEALETRSRVLGDEHPDTLKSIRGMGFQFHALGNVAEAERCFRRAMEGNRRVLGEEHPETLNSITDVGIMLRSLGRLDEAESYCREVLERKRRVLGTEHPETLYSITNMGAVMRAQGRMSEAELYYRDALDANRNVLGDAHPDTLAALNNMGHVLQLQGRLSDAEPYCREALEGYRRALGNDHPNTMVAAGIVGSVLHAQGRLSDAEPYLRDALEGQRRALGNAHAHTLESLNRLAWLLQSQGRVDDAEPYVHEVLEVRRRALGDAHPDTLVSINNMGFILEAQGELDGAEVYYREALGVQRRLLGDLHPDTLTSISNMGSVLHAQGRLVEAEPYFHEALDARRGVLGDAHPDTLVSINNMGSLLEVQGKLVDAESYMREALEVRRRVLGDAHPDTLVSINNMGSLLNAQGKLAEAEPLYREALATAEKLRIDVIGGAQERAAFAGKLNLPAIAAGYARTLVALDRAPEALTVVERGRGRAALDLLSGNTAAAITALREVGDAERLARYDAAVQAETDANTALLEAEKRVPALVKERKAYEIITTLTDQEKQVRLADFDAQIEVQRALVLQRRRELGERTSAVFAELRGLVPAGNPLTSEEIIAALAPGEALLSYSWTGDGVVALLAHDGAVDGVTLANGKDESTALNDAAHVLRSAISSRPGHGQALPPAVLDAARNAVLPKELREVLAGAALVMVIPDGPLHGVPMELLLEDAPIAYAPSATIAIDRRRAAEDRQTRFASAVIVGDPDFGGAVHDEPDYPDTGVLLSMVQEGSNAAIAGLRRGDVVLSYAGAPLTSAQDLGPAVAAATETFATRGADERPVVAQVWRDGEIIEATLAVGRVGVQMDQRPPADGLRSMAFMDRSADAQSAQVTAMEQIRLHGAALTPLPGARREAQAVAEMLGSDATLLLGADATAPRLRSAVLDHTPRVIHLATHGLTGNADRPLEASLALTIPAEPTTDDIGFLTLEEILHHWLTRLNGTELVVLSACDTGRGVQRGDTTMALPLGFFVCGAETVVASLWKVDDTATALLMARFYANWLGRTGSVRTVDGESYSPGQAMPKLAALREARSWLRSLTTADCDRLTGANPNTIAEEASRGVRRVRLHPDATPTSTPTPDDLPYDHPYFWSAFVLYGHEG